MKLRARLFSGYILGFLLMVGIAGSTYLGINSLLETARMVIHTETVISDARLIEKILVDIETGQRGFLITGTERFLEPIMMG